MAKSLGPLTGARVVERARSAVGAGTRYGLGMGGRNPFARHPSVLVRGVRVCDCSGFAAWCVGVDRYLPNAVVPHLPGGEWFETTNLWRDARSPFGFVREVPWIDARAGDLLVYPDRGARQGHVGVVVAVDSGPLEVLHCSRKNQSQTGDAIASTGPRVFVAGGAVVARVQWVA